MATRRPPKRRFLETEHRLLCLAVQEATHWLSEGEYAAGYRCLHDGLQRAKEWEDSGEPWAEELVAAWRGALFEYAELYPASQKVPMTPKPQIPPEWQDCSYLAVSTELASGRTGTQGRALPGAEAQ
jgi:hypothetical protein